MVTKCLLSSRLHGGSINNDIISDQVSPTETSPLWDDWESSSLCQIFRHAHPVFLVVDFALSLRLSGYLFSSTLLDILLVGARGKQTLDYLLDAGADLLSALSELCVVFLLFPGLLCI